MYTFYTQVDSPLHRLNPLSKFLMPLPVVFFVALTTDPWIPIAFLIFVSLILLLLGNIPLKRYLKLITPLFALSSGFLLIYPFVVRETLVNETPLLFEMGFIHVYQGGMIFALATALRISTLVLLSMMFTLTTDATDFIRALIQQWRLPYKIGFGALAAFRFLPLLHSELQLIRAAHRVRGVSDREGLKGLYQQLSRYAVPLMATAIRQAERTALTMDGRAFGAYEDRTYFRQFSFDSHDYLYIGGFWLLSLLIILSIWQAGLMGSLVILQYSQ
ncbi:MAG: energy-coupling factor transporter transmembrane component T [Chloroflexota bacterium]